MRHGFLGFCLERRCSGQCGSNIGTTSGKEKCVGLGNLWHELCSASAVHRISVGFTGTAAEPTFCSGVGGSTTTNPYWTLDELAELSERIGASDLGNPSQEFLRSIIEFSDTLIREIMVPRTEMVTLSISASANDVRRMVLEKDTHVFLFTMRPSITSQVSFTLNDSLLLKLRHIRVEKRRYYASRNSSNPLFMFPRS